MATTTLRPSSPFRPPGALQFDESFLRQHVLGKSSIETPAPAIPRQDTVRREAKSSPTDFFETLNATHVVSSPYAEFNHLLSLDALDLPNLCLALALTLLEPIRPDYATCEYQLAFNWSHVMHSLVSLAAGAKIGWTRQTFYVVEFRSRVKQDINRELLYSLDKESHAEATASGGLLKYWYGVPDEQRNNLATCRYMPQMMMSPSPRPLLTTAHRSLA